MDLQWLVLLFFWKATHCHMISYPISSVHSPQYSSYHQFPPRLRGCDIFKAIAPGRNKKTRGKIQKRYTHPKMNECVPGKGTIWKGNFIFQPSFLKGYIRFHGCTAQYSRDSFFWSIYSQECTLAWIFQHVLAKPKPVSACLYLHKKKTNTTFHPAQFISGNAWKPRSRRLKSPPWCHKGAPQGLMKAVILTLHLPQWHTGMPHQNTSKNQALVWHTPCEYLQWLFHTIPLSVLRYFRPWQSHKTRPGGVTTSFRPWAYHINKI